MTSEPDWTPPANDAPVGGPPPPPPAGFGPPVVRPAVVTIAATLWICLGALLFLGMIGYAVNNQPLAGVPSGPVPILFGTGVGAAFIVLAIFLLRGGNGARIALTVLGSIMLLGIWPVLFVVPALILQFQRSSNAWFYALNQPPPVG